jgi:hypothetical protein
VTDRVKCRRRITDVLIVHVKIDAE